MVNIAPTQNFNIDIEIKDALKIIFQMGNIYSKDDLDRFCGGSRDSLYNKVKNITNTHWNRLDCPEDYVRSYYQDMLIGYKRYKGN